MKHVILTGEVGAGKSTVLERTLRLLDARVEGIVTGTYVPRGVKEKTLYMRAYGDTAWGCPFARLPGGDKAYAARCFDEVGVRLLRRARQRGELIVLDELGWLESDASIYHQELRTTLDGNIPVFAVLRQNKTVWADWIRERSDVMLLTVTTQNRDNLPEMAADILCPYPCKRHRTDSQENESVCYEF